MPGSTLSASDEPRFPNSTYSAANITANPSQWRPHTSRSGRSARSASPLFARWARRHHQQLDVHGSNDSRSSTERKSTSSNGNGNSLNNDDASHKHTYNFSTSTMTRSSSSSRRQSQSALPPPLTREEFEALPLAIQRKYFSTLERLRFAQASGIDDISQHYDQITARNFKRRLARQDRSASENHVNLRRRSVLESRFSSADSLAFASLPEKIKKRHFTREEQSILTRQLRASVVLDAADEVVYKVGRRASRHLNVPQDMDLVAPSFPQQRNNSMDSLGTNRHVADESRGANFPESFYDTFRWLDEEDDLDLRLFLDDYHANLREHVPEPSKQRRPSFRRHLSISKIPFGRTSISASRPPTRDPVSSPKTPAQSPLSTSSEFHFGHQRRKSRALSLITPKHAPQDSITTIDPSPAHYQDPEARLKLRVYLASPQKFDEAIEFGFPSTDILPGSPPAANEGRTLSKRQSEHKLSDDTNLRTFLADDDDDDDDDKMSLNSDQPSVADPDSPQTPHAFDKGPVRPVRVASDQTLTHASKPSEGGYTQVPAFSREMTLRMTLTRPDLRAHEEQIYGWQKPVPQTGRKSPQMGRKSHQLTQAQDESTSNVDYFADGLRKESMEKIFAGIDATNNNTDQNVMRRIWNRVRRS
ncbi:hypothetical protein BR93DRAFT_964561 [Coniochaeta sp. PMI_546]|nr:hypothetical protein BR93DRAFT_964561 [Coniochaeta sp. PMI_546]